MPETLMPMPPYTIRCYEPQCPDEAVYKIAARWSDGLTQDLKTYGLTCARCLPHWFRRSLEKQRACRRAKNETLEPPGIYRLAHGRRDVQLQRLPELEAELLTSFETSSTESLGNKPG
jgi:hypothetical protein